MESRFTQNFIHAPLRQFTECVYVTYFSHTFTECVNSYVTYFLLLLLFYVEINYTENQSYTEMNILGKSPLLESPISAHIFTILFIHNACGLETLSPHSSPTGQLQP